MRTPDNIFRDAYLYLLVTFIGIPCTFFYNLLSNIIRALGDSRTPFWFLLFSMVLNIALDLFCILTLGWGVLGAAVATVVSQGVSAALCFAYMHRHFGILRAHEQCDLISCIEFLLEVFALVDALEPRIAADLGVHHVHRSAIRVFV